jgi:hypothetical protein
MFETQVGSLERWKRNKRGFSDMLVGYMRVPSDNDRQTADLQRNALLAAGVAPRHLFEAKASGAREITPDSSRRLTMSGPAIAWSAGTWTGSAACCRLCSVLSPPYRRRAWHFAPGPSRGTPPPRRGRSCCVSLGRWRRMNARRRRNAYGPGWRPHDAAGNEGGRPQAISAEKREAILAAWHAVASTVSRCRPFGGETHHPR